MHEEQQSLSTLGVYRQIVQSGDNIPTIQKCPETESSNYKDIQSAVLNERGRIEELPQ
jgi:hypothetical protein